MSPEHIQIGVGGMFALLVLREVGGFVTVIVKQLNQKKEETPLAPKDKGGNGHDRGGVLLLNGDCFQQTLDAILAQNKMLVSLAARMDAVTEALKDLEHNTTEALRDLENHTDEEIRLLHRVEKRLDMEKQ